MPEAAEAADGPAAPEQTYSEYPAPEYPEQDYQAPEAPPGFLRRFMANKVMLLGTVIVIVVMIVAAAMMAGGGGGFLGGGQAPPAAAKLMPMDGTIPKADAPQVKTGPAYEVPLPFGDGNDTSVSNIYEVSVACSWTDDYAGSDPDTMKFELLSPDGQNVSQTSEGTSGSAQLTIKTNVTDKKLEDNTQGWVLKATCVKAGGKPVGPFGFLIYVDAGNNFSATVTYKYYGHEGAKTNSTK